MENRMKEIAGHILGYPLAAENGMSAEEIEEIEKKLTQKLPVALKEFYHAVGNMDIFMSSFEIFPEPYLIDDKIIFLEENQGVCYWGINRNDVNKETSIVYICTDLNTENPEWYSEDVTLAEFLKIIMYYQCAQGGFEYGSAIYEDNFECREKIYRFS